MLSNIWVVHIRTGHINLWIPFPMFVLRDLLLSLDDLCEVILPRFGLPNYAAIIGELLYALTDMPPGMPLVDVQTEEADVLIRPMERRAHA